MPVARTCGSKRPGDAVQGQPGLYMWIDCDIQVVIVINKIMVPHLPINGYDGHDQKKTNQQIRSYLQGVISIGNSVVHE